MWRVQLHPKTKRFRTVLDGFKHFRQLQLKIQSSFRNFSLFRSNVQLKLLFKTSSLRRENFCFPQKQQPNTRTSFFSFSSPRDTHCLHTLQSNLNVFSATNLAKSQELSNSKCSKKQRAPCCHGQMRTVSLIIVYKWFPFLVRCDCCITVSFLRQRERGIALFLTARRFPVRRKQKLNSKSMRKSRIWSHVGIDTGSRYL